MKGTSQPGMVGKARPYRVVFVAHSSGEAAAYISTAGIGVADIERQITLDPGRIGVGNISEMFRERLDIDLLDWQAQRIARALNIMRVTCNWQDASYPASVIKRIENAIVELLVELPSVIEFECDHVSHGSNPGYLIKYRLANVEVFEGLLAAARRGREVVTKQPRRVREAPWHSDALWIASFVSMVGTRVGRTAMNFRNAESQEVLLIESLLRLANINVDNAAIAICFRRRKAKVPRIAYIAPEQP